MMHGRRGAPGLLAALLACLALTLYAWLPTAQPLTIASAATVAQPPLGDGVRGVRLLVEPGDGRRPLTRPMLRATQSLDMTMYLLTDHTMIHDLEHAAANGVRVRVLLEQQPFGNDVSGRSANQSAYDQLYAADIPVRWTSRRYRLTHQKTMIVDGATAYILTLNYSKSAFKLNREFGVVDSDPIDVGEAQAIFNADWSGGTPVVRDPNLVLSPVNSRARLLALLGRARHEVAVYAEEVQDTALEDALIAAEQRGAQVRLISNAGDSTNAPGLARLQHGGVHTHLLRTPYIHAKAILVDGRWAFVGSENISTSSLDLNRELGLLIADPDALARLGATFEQDWRR